MSHVVGIDIGTSGIKVGAMDQAGNLEFVSNQSYSLLYPQKGWMEIDVDDIWEKIKSLLIDITQKVNEKGSVDAISLSSFCNSSVFLDKNGNALMPGIMYLDQRSKEEAARIKKEIGEDVLYDITRNRLEPGMFTASTLLWVKEKRPDIYQQTYKWGNLSTYILFKLTGQYLMDWTQASFSGLFNVVKYQWSEEIYKRLQIDLNILPEIADPIQVAGEMTLSEGNVDLTGIPVVTGAADTACSTLALGVEPNEMFESVGTSNVLTVCTDNPASIDTRFLNRCHVKKNQWLSHGAMSTPGASIRWFYENFLQEEDNSTSILEELPLKSTPGSNGIFFLPYMQGERTPIWDPNARGVFAGLHLNSTKADMYRAILEGCSYGLRQIDEIIENQYHLHFDSFQSIGGGAKNRVWAQIKANVLNKDIEIKEISETAVFGVCVIAATAIGYFDNYEQAVDNIENETVNIVKPEPELIPFYNDQFNKFSQLYPSLKEFFSI